MNEALPHKTFKSQGIIAGWSYPLDSQDCWSTCGAKKKTIASWIIKHLKKLNKKEINNQLAGSSHQMRTLIIPLLQKLNKRDNSFSAFTVYLQFPIFFCQNLGSVCCSLFVSCLGRHFVKSTQPSDRLCLWQCFFSNHHKKIQVGPK